MSRHEERENELRLAIRRVELGRTRNVKPGTAMSIATVARECGVDPSTIHTRYPAIAEAIRERIGKSARKRRDVQRTEISELRRKLRQAKMRASELREHLRHQASRDATALLESQVATNGARIRKAKKHNSLAEPESRKDDPIKV